MSLHDFYSGWREGGIEGLEVGFAQQVHRMLLALPAHLKGKVTITSAYRSVQAQEQLWRDAVAKYGSEAAARKWVAPPGRSNHGRGLAIDLNYASNEARRWVHDNAAAFGLAFPLAHENWHIEPAGLRSGTFRPSGQTYGDGQHYGPAQEWGEPGTAFTPDPDAYTDGLGLFKPEPFTLESSLLYVADQIGITERARGLRVSDPNRLADRNLASGTTLPRVGTSLMNQEISHVR